MSRLLISSISDASCDSEIPVLSDTTCSSLPEVRGTSERMFLTRNFILDSYFSGVYQAKTAVATMLVKRVQMISHLRLNRPVARSRRPKLLFGVVTCPGRAP